MTAELKPDLILIAAAVKTILLLFEIVNVDAELVGVVEYRRSRPTLTGHAGKIIERTQLAYRPPSFPLAADQSRNIALDPEVRLRIPKTDMLQHRCVRRT